MADGDASSIVETGRTSHAAWSRPVRAQRRRWRWRPVGLLMIGTSVLLPLVLFAFQARDNWTKVWQGAVREIEQSSQAAAEHSLRVLVGHAHMAERIAELVAGLTDAEVRAREVELHRRMLAFEAAVPRASASVVTDRHGGILVASALYPVAWPNALAATGEHFLVLRENDAPLHMSLVQSSPGFDRRMIVISRPRSAAARDAMGDDFDGMVSVALSRTVMATQMARLRHRPEDIVALMHRDGQVLAQSFGSPWLGGAEEVFAAAGARPAVFEAVGRADGLRRVFAATPVEGWPAFAVVGRERASIVAEWWASLHSEMSVALLAMGVLLGLSLTLHRDERNLVSSNTMLKQQLWQRAQELEASESRLQAALEAGRVFAFEVDLQARRVRRSASAARILGLSEAEAADQDGDAALDRVVAEDRATVERLWTGLAADAPYFSTQSRFRRPDGHVAWLRSEGRGEFDREGRLVRLAGLSRDITAEAEAEAGRRDAQARLRVATEGAGFGIYELDLGRRTAWFDERAAAVLGGVVPRERWIGIGGPEWAGVQEAVHPDDRAVFEANWRGLLDGSKNDCTVEFRVRTPAGGQAWVWCRGVLIERGGAEGRPGRLVGLLQDVSARRRLECDLRQAQKLQVLGELSAGIAHDVNAVLQVIGAQAGMARREAEEPERVRRRLAQVDQTVAKGAAITRRLLAFSRQGEMRAEALSAEAVLEDVRAMVAPGLGGGIRVDVVAEAGLPAMRADGEQLATVLMNLATNARDAMKLGGVLELGAALEVVGPGRRAGVPAGLPEGRHVRLWARDTGVGMDAATLARAVEPFFTTKPAGQGTGLGLAMAQSFADRSGGAMTVESAEGRGTTVTIWLPCVG